jgi:ion channel
VARLHVRELLSGQHGYAILLVLVLSSAAYTVATPETDFWYFGNIVLQSLIVVVAVLAAHPRRTVGRLLDGAAVAAIALATISFISESDSSRDFAIIGALLAAVVPVVVGRSLIRELRRDGASERVIAGALAIYLLIGMFCAFLYAVIAQIGDGPLFADGKGDGTSAIHVYFSFITQTTVGYGDYVPAEPTARSVAMGQALTGQLYLVTVISLLVGSFIGTRTQRADGD